ncbi:nuclear transport factor 2 family protein [Streptomyces sp. NPDC060198]|uniref:nuclear transport factor 2 family protein n=1 Tax=Streptomyces sp. NPDC060198 TaxID=3347070 RepID=UPI0036654A1B
MTAEMGAGTVSTAVLRKAVETYWTAADARDWEAFAATLDDDVVFEVPQTREVVRGKERCVRFNREYPGDWHVRIDRIVADLPEHPAVAGGSGLGGQAAARTLFTVGGAELDGIHFFSFDTRGRITAVTDFWPEPYEPPTGREYLVERV